MNPLNAIIIDDERPARKELFFLLKDFPEINIIGDTDNLKDAIELITSKKPDLVFLDIQLSGENGFDLLEKVCVDFKIIFVTAYDEFAIKAFDVNASDYLLKPVDPKRLKLALKRIFENPSDEKALIKKFDYNDLIYLQQNNCTARFVEINNIIAITSVGNHSKILTTNRKSYIILKTLKQWIEELPSAFFIRIHRSTIVNIKYIEKVENYSKALHQVYLKQLDTPFEVSRNCLKELKKVYK
ncbi:MAG: LytTR family DNA-binding domain-containing protein [Bacteroidales bacterium]|nr:LytTR family DNA-binding domain-containing protein [Bacteroidales bacterium]